MPPPPLPASTPSRNKRAASGSIETSPEERRVRSKPSAESNSSNEGGVSSQARWKKVKTKEGRTAEEYLVEWLCDGENYTRWKNTNGVGKEGMGQKILDQMGEAGFDLAGCKNVSGLISKIKYIIKVWSQAHEELQQTGSGSTDSDMESQDPDERVKTAAWQAKFEARYPYYRMLEPILGSRTLYDPKCVLDSSRTDQRPLEQQLGIEDGVALPGSRSRSQAPRTPQKRNAPPTEENSFGGVSGDMESDPDIIAMMNGTDEFDDDDGVPTGPGFRSLAATPIQQRSPSSFSTSSRGSISASVSAASRQVAKESAKKKGKGQDDASAPMAAAMLKQSEIDEKTFEADQEYRKQLLETKAEERRFEERRVVIEERKLQQELADREAIREQERSKNEHSQRMERINAYLQLRKDGMSAKQAKRLAGITDEMDED
ncbi:hypothetical protein HD553DRAFT_341839 [Filobasidium floriforme]|uniref:uncharacterized protein n=1 Tax=Filobasidium floriforme TaxID=5210 RepID=UPI001E8DAA57|nr:uncharacterized protein HD553DRAFT_341839 [Filobasidium floriforme]KAH8085215.1 hypothetical protein HD553DRAFT_341839 [Filobasidium floriforme]